MPEPDQETGRARSSPREAALIGVACAVAFAGLAWWLARPVALQADRPAIVAAGVDPAYANYAGDRACRECHPGESAAHSGSGHARTLRPAAGAAGKLDGVEVEDPERPGVAWRFAFEAGRLVAGRAEAGAAPERYLVDYALGSGRHATTYLSMLDRDPARPTALEHRLTEFAHLGGLGLTPGQKATTHAPGNTPHGRVHPAWATLKCFSCHVTVTSDRGPTVLDEATMIPNVGCERCHGPARGHVEAARRGATGPELALPFGEGNWSDPQLMKLCGDCHRLPEMGAPGENRVDNASIVRHQPVGLMLSACFTRGGGRIGCVTCHDPHARTSTDRPAYEAACLSCHGPAPARKPCPVSPGQGCVACHMPRRDVGAGMMMADHWIRVVPPPPASLPGAVE